jgi:hypothetical protein
MRESTDRMQAALHSKDAGEHLIARRILESPGTFHSWEIEHSGLMRQVADQGALSLQAVALRQAALRLIHGKALFEYLKRHTVRGEERARVLAHFYPTRAYAYAMVQEHGVYLRKAGSYICTNHVGSDVVRDPAFFDPMQHYEDLYNEYFESYCAALFGREGLDSAQERLLPLLKHQLSEWRRVILNPREGAARLRREGEIRRPTGDTQRLPTLKK